MLDRVGIRLRDNKTRVLWSAPRRDLHLGSPSVARELEIGLEWTIVKWPTPLKEVDISGWQRSEFLERGATRAGEQGAMERGKRRSELRTQNSSDNS